MAGEQVPRTSYDSQATASDATDGEEEEYRDGEEMMVYPPKRVSSRYVDVEEAVGLDEEEVVGLMQDDRDGPEWMGKAGRGRRRTGVVKGGLIFAGVVIGFVLGVPTIQWLSSGVSTATSPSTAGSSPANSGIVPAASSIDTSSSGEWKQLASPDTPSGHYALSNTTHFLVDFQDPSWNTFAQAALGTGLDLTEVASSKSKSGQDLMPIDMDTVFGGTLSPQSSDLEWSDEDPDEGVFSHVDWRKRDIWLEDVTHARHAETGTGKVASFGGKNLIVEGKNVLDGRGKMLDWTRFKFSPDVKWVLFWSSEVDQWRYSKKSHLWLHNIASKKTVSLGTGASQPPKVTYAAWAPAVPGSTDAPSLAFVEDNNLFFVPRAGEPAIKVTQDGAATIFNAVPDWVYEEEVYGSDSVMWFSPGGSKLVFLRLDETEVPVYEFPKYNPDAYRAGMTTPYQQMVSMKYPKPGFPNPTVSVKMIDLEEIRRATKKGVSVMPTQYTLHSPMVGKGKAENEVDRVLSSDAGVKERLVTEVKWVGDDELLVRETDRYSDVMRVVLFDLSSGESAKSAGTDMVGQVVRRQDARAEKSGWIRAAQTIEPLSHHNLSIKSTAYLDIVVSPEGFRHLAYYESADSDKPTFLTAGRWEIADLKHVDAKRSRAYFVAARPTPALRNVYYVELPDWKKKSGKTEYAVKEPVAMTDVSKPGSYDVSFDPKGAYYVLNYAGPDVPYQKVVGVDDPSFELMLEENTLLRQMSSQYVKPSNTFYQLKLNSTLPDGSQTVASVKEIRPHDFDASGATKYPVLFRVYGGPDSQLVDARWNRADWHQYVASTLGYIVVVVDGRGTGFKGQQYRSCVSSDLGHLEASDVNEAATLISTLPYIDSTRLGLWGWSYGGYLTAKTISQPNSPFSLAISVAPVTNWLFYDSVYTERYLKSPITNAQGYDTAAVHVTSGFDKTKFFLMQGSADDNVHFSNSAHLLDLLTKQKVRGFRFRMFTDSSHSIRTRGANRELYEEMTAFLKENWGAGGKREAKEKGKGKGKGRPALHNSVE
ncbi:Dipeptidyl aminopeptidase B [Pseudozyma hubeiensis]|nr:Dipeptidyl aminopeptidase B [Pseudozyma hubeiensis]